MASIVLRQFGGMAPSANTKAIPEAQATYARNLNLRFGDFRPLPVPANVTTAVAGSTLYKFIGADTFITKPGDVSFVRGPIPNDVTERTYYTGDGVPKVTDLTLAIRQLGVPAPTAAPTVTVNTVAQFSTEDSRASQPALLAQITSAIRANTFISYRGASLSTIAPLIGSARPWEYSFVASGTVDGSGVFTPTNAANNNLMDARFAFYRTTNNSNPVIQVPLTMMARTWEVAETMTAALTAIKDPSDVTKNLLTSDQVVKVITELNNHLAPATDILAKNAARLTKVKDDFVALANSTAALDEAASVLMKQFYARSDVSTKISNAKATAANEILNALITFNQTNYG